MLSTVDTAVPPEVTSEITPDVFHDVMRQLRQGSVSASDTSVHVGTFEVRPTGLSVNRDRNGTTYNISIYEGQHPRARHAFTTISFETLAAFSDELAAFVAKARDEQTPNAG